MLEYGGSWGYHVSFSHETGRVDVTPPLFQTLGTERHDGVVNTVRRISLILRRSRTGTVWFYTSTSNKRAARPKLYTKSLTRDLKRKYIRFTLVRISIKL